VPRRWLPFAAHLLPVLWLFGDAIVGGRLPYFRDVSFYYFPNYVFLERALRQGVWPLWNPTCDAGVPFLMSYPVELLLVAVLGAEGALRVDGPLHLLLAMCGASLLARILGLGPWGVWAAGLFFGLSGYVLSSANLFELYHATAWAPWVAAAMVAAWRRPGPWSAAALAVVSALQVSTLGAEVVLQAALLGLVLFRERPDRRRMAWMAVAAVVALALAAPALSGARALVEGTRRAEGLASQEALAWSAHPVVLAGLVLPHFFGDPHTLTDRGFWGQGFFPDGYPYLVSLYMSLGTIMLAALSGPFPGRARLWGVIALGVLLALGAHGPLAPLVSVALRHFRVPLKFLLCANLALCLLAAQGLARAAAGGARVRWMTLLPGALLLAAAGALLLAPSVWIAAVEDARARYVIGTAWPGAFATAGALLVGVALALRSVRWAPAAGVLVGLDLLSANGTVNRFTDRGFYTLRPEMKRLIDSAREGSDARWFSYGVLGTPDLRWSPEMLRRNSDVWLYYVDRQTLLPRTHVLDGVDGAFDEDRVGWAPAGSTLTGAERAPAAFRGHHERLRQAGVRWVISFRPLPEDLARLHGEAQFPEVLESVKLYEVKDPWPRAFWTSAADGAITPGSGSVRWERLDPHTVRLHVNASPGHVVFTEGFHRSWVAEDARGAARPIRRVGDRYWAMPTPGGGDVITARFVPGWRTPSLVACGFGLAGVMGLLLAGRREAAA
jgi:hypothetical protein